MDVPASSYPFVRERLLFLVASEGHHVAGIPEVSPTALLHVDHLGILERRVVCQLWMYALDLVGENMLEFGRSGSRPRYSIYKLEASLHTPEKSVVLGWPQLFCLL